MKAVFAFFVTFWLAFVVFQDITVFAASTKIVGITLITVRDNTLLAFSVINSITWLADLTDSWSFTDIAGRRTKRFAFAVL